jgi:DNA-binding transcriptional MerR regulator
MLDPVGRTAATHRRYTDEDLSWIVLLTRLRGTGMPIRRMREYADLVRAGEGNEQERLALLEAHRAAVLEQLEQVQRSLAAIETKIDFYREQIS